MRTSLDACPRWVPPAPVGEEEVRTLASALGAPREFAELLVRRGVESSDAARSLLVPHLDDLHDPFLLPDMYPAVERLQRAIARGEKILVHGDYDADGMSAAALLTLALRRLGVPAEPFVPHRTRDGYDLSEAGLERAARAGASLILTADCGVSAIDAVARAARQGRDVIVTDHHRPGRRLPGAVAVVNPMREDSEYPFRDLAGVGVAFKLVQALFAAEGIAAPEANQHLDLVAIGTVADQMPLVDENRALVRAGLRVLQRSRKPGLRAILERTGVSEGEPVAADHISFRLAPRLNSVGRMDSAEAGLRVLMSEDPREADRLASHLERQNAQRRDADREVTVQVERLLDDTFDPERDRAVVLWGDGWHPGVIGIVASRVVEATHRPTVVVTFDGETGRGSGRSVEGFHLFRALQELSPMLERFGGHRMAAGLSIRRDRVEEFAERLRSLAATRLSEEATQPELRIDLVLPLERAGEELRDWLDRLAPFGTENPPPVLVVEDVRLERGKAVGAQGAHLRVELARDEHRLAGIGFRLGHRVGELAPEARWDVAFHLEENRWNGRRLVQARILDFRPARP